MLATNITETLLTVDSVKIVVDSGLVREPRFDPPNRNESLDHHGDEPGFRRATLRALRASAQRLALGEQLYMLCQNVSEL